MLSESLDGKNLEAVLLELGTRLHKVIFEHVQTHSINEMGEPIIIYLYTFKPKSTINFKNESTTGADASVEMPKLHNIKLLIAFIHMINKINFAACKNSGSG